MVAFFSNAATAVEADVTHIDALLESVLVDEKEIILPPQAGAGQAVVADAVEFGAAYQIINGVLVPAQVVHETLTDDESDRNEIAACVRYAYYAQKVADGVVSNAAGDTYATLLAQQRRKVRRVQLARLLRNLNPSGNLQEALQAPAPAAEVAPAEQAVAAVAQDGGDDGGNDGVGGEVGADNDGGAVGGDAVNVDDGAQG